MRARDVNLWLTGVPAGSVDDDVDTLIELTGTAMGWVAIRRFVSSWNGGDGRHIVGSKFETWATKYVKISFDENRFWPLLRLYNKRLNALFQTNFDITAELAQYLYSFN
ncbi:hypothetical protein ABW21_db0209679 [Orbilia brochopaga]|nr:hypothetical protein ABW21_db0209679 [Drechslerella brochopaga]